MKTTLSTAQPILVLAAVLVVSLSSATSWAAKPDTHVPAKPEEHDAEGHPTDYKNPIRDGSVGGVPHYHVTICEGTTLGWNPWGSGHRYNEPQSDQSKNRDTTTPSKSDRTHAACSSAGGTDGQVAITGRTEGSTECTVTLKEDDGTVRTLVVLVHVVKCTNENKGHRGVALGPASLPTGTPLQSLIQEGQVKIDTVGTGETIGHVGDLELENLTDQPIDGAVGPMVLESKSRKNQDYVCPKPQTAKIEPHGTATIPMDGVCIDRNKPPVGKGVRGDLAVNTGDPTIPQNPDSHIPANQARDLLRICTAKYEAAEKLQKDGALKDLPYHDPQQQINIAEQWSTWSDPRVSEITGVPPATKEDLRKVVYKQVQAKGPITPATKKKVDQGIDTIFEKVELTTAKAKDLEKPDQYAQVETTGGQGEGATPPAGGVTTEGEGTPAVGQPEYIAQTRAKMPTPTPTPKPGGGKAPPKPQQPAPPPPAPDYPTKDQVATFEDKQNKEIKKAKEELEKAGTEADKQKRAKAKLNALEKICFEAKWAGTHAKDDKKNATNGYNDASEILKRIDEVPDARDRLKKAGLSDKTINELLDALNNSATGGDTPDQGSVTGLPSDRQIAQQAGDALRASGYDANTDGGKKGEQAAIDLKELYMAEGKYNKNAK